MDCWNCDKLVPAIYIEIYKDYDLGPNGTWLEVSMGRPHNFKKCWKQLQIQTGKWKVYEKKKEPEPVVYYEYPDLWLWPARFKAELDHLRRDKD